MWPRCPDDGAAGLAGETIIVTVNGRQVAQLGPVRSRQWRHGSEVMAIFDGPADVDWIADRELLDDAIVDPFDE